MAIWLRHIPFTPLHTYLVRCQWCRHEMIGLRFNANTARAAAIQREIDHYETCPAVPMWDRKAKVESAETVDPDPAA